MGHQGMGSDPRGVSPVIGVVLLVAMTVMLAATVGVMVTGLADDGPDSPQYTTIEVESVEKSVDGIEVPDAGDCQHYHLVIRLTHTGGNSLDSEDLEYVIDVSGDDGTTLSGRFDESVARSGATAKAGDEILIAIDSDTDEANCGEDSEDSKSTVLLGGQPAWHHDEAGQVGGLWNTYATFLSHDDETLTDVHVRIIHTPSDTMLVDETTDDVVDVS